MMVFYEILGQIMAEKQMSIADVARTCGLTDSTVRSIFDRHQKKIALNVAFKLADGLGVSLERLNGQAEQDTKKSPSDISEEARKIAVGFDKLDKRGKRVVQAVLDCESIPVPEAPKSAIQPLPASPKAKHRSDGFTEIRAYEQPAAAGLGNYLDEPPYHMEQYTSEIIPEKTDFGIVISGDSMEPEIHNGATVFVQNCSTLDAGEVGIFVLGGKAYCKMLYIDHDKRQVRLVSINKAYDDIVVGENDDFYTLGRVLGQYAPRFQ